MSWFVDNAITLSILFGLVAAALLMIWRSNRQNKYLGFAAGAIALIGLIWLLTLFVPTDRKQLEANVREMAHAVEAGKIDDLFKHVSKDFRHGQTTRAELYAFTQDAIKQHAISDIRISHFRVGELSREKRLAKTSFLVAASADREARLRAEADFVLEDGKWKLQTMRLYNPFVNQDQEIDWPGF